MLWRRYAAASPGNQSTSMKAPTGTAQAMTYAGTTHDERLTSGSDTFLNGQIGLATKTNAGTTIAFTRDPSGTLISARTGTATSYTSQYYLYDTRSSVVAVTDGTTGGLAAVYDYDPYGDTLLYGGTSTNPYRYSAGYYDTTTGLYKYGTRYYNPTQGRWTQPDPVPAANLYIYAGNNPINNRDSTGRDWDIDWGNVAERAGVEALIMGVALGVAGCARGAIATTFIVPGVGTVLDVSRAGQVA